jgi:uncharacterized protein (DUF2267 family)
MRCGPASVMSFKTIMLWLTPQQTDDVSNQLQHASNHLVQHWTDCENEQSEQKLKQQFMPALRWYFKSHPPRDGYEAFLRLELFDVIRDIRDVSDAKRFWVTLVELMRTHTAIIS